MAITLGLDLTDDYIAVYESGDEAALIYPAVICREKKGEEWYIGEDAYRIALSGQGVMTDKLLKLLMKDGTSTINRRVYRAEDLVARLISRVLEEKLKTSDFSCIQKLAMSLHEPSKELMDKVSECLELAGVKRDRLLIVSHEEAFIYYTLSREREIYSNMVSLFDLSSETLCYYEFMVVRGISRQCAVAEGTDIEEAFHTDILKKDAGRTLGDRIITDVAKRHMEGKVFSAAFLTGSGFDRTDWAPGFIEYLAKRRKVMLEKGLFAIGAGVASEDSLREESGYPYLIFCNTRLSSEVSLDIAVGERKSRLILVPAGERWYGLAIHVELLPREQDYIDFIVEPFDKAKERRTERALLDTFPKRPDRTTRVAVDINFESADTAGVCIGDMGFGDLYPSSGKKIYEELVL